MATKAKPRKSARMIVLASLKRRKNGATARQLGESLIGGKHPAIQGKYALANARKVVYSMIQRGELERDEQGIVSLPQS